MVRTMRFIGRVWLTLAGTLIFLSYALILYQEGFWRLTEIISPHNFINYIAVIVTLAPGIGLIMWADKIEQKRAQRARAQSSPSSDG